VGNDRSTGAAGAGSFRSSGPATWVSEPARVAIVAPTRLCRDGLAAALADADTLRVVGVVSEQRDDLLRLAGVERAVIVIDAAAGLPETLPILRSVVMQCRLVVFGLSSDAEVLACAQHEVAGYLDRSAGIDELVDAIRIVDAGELVCPPSVTSVLIRQVGSGPAPERAPRRLTPRELEIIALLDEGLSNKQIAARLQIEVATVKNHVHNVLDKLEVQRRSQAARRCREAGAGISFSYELAMQQRESTVAAVDPI
jgi:two-component system, NarL family, nitrate/nitrite response regulator NarL